MNAPAYMPTARSQSNNSRLASTRPPKSPSHCAWAWVPVNRDDREVLAAVAKLNNDMGAIVMALLNSGRAGGSLAPRTLRELAATCDDISSLLDNHADGLERIVPMVVSSATSPKHPADAVDLPPAASAGPPTREGLHARITDLRERARQAAVLGQVEPSMNLAAAADATVRDCGCGQCPSHELPRGRRRKGTRH